MNMVGGLDLHRRQITYDVLDVDSGEIWRGRLWQPDRSRFRRWLRTRGQRSSTRRLGGARSGGLHGLALRRRGDLGSGLRAVPRRAGRHPSGARTQAPSEDRPHRRPAAAGAPPSRRAPRELDPTRRRLGVARTRPALQVPRRPENTVVPTDPRRALSPRGHDPRGRYPHREDPIDASRTATFGSPRPVTSGSTSATR